MQQREHGRQWLELAGKTVVITGAAGGIGTALAAAFHDAGARLALLDRDVEKCAKLAAALDQPSALTVACDVADAASVTGAADLVQREMGGADILVNNAAILASGDLMELDVAEWRRLLAVNLDGCFLCAQAFGRHMRVRGGGRDRARRLGIWHVSAAGERSLQHSQGRGGDAFQAHRGRMGPMGNSE